MIFFFCTSFIAVGLMDTVFGRDVDNEEIAL